MLQTRSITLAVALFVSLALSMPTASAYTEPPGGAVFNNPQGGRDAQFRIIQTVNKAIKGTRRGSRIQMSTFLMDSKVSTRLLLAARKRGVRVQVVMDGNARNPQSRRLARVLNRDNHKRVLSARALARHHRAVHEQRRHLRRNHGTNKQVRREHARTKHGKDRRAERKHLRDKHAKLRRPRGRRVVGGPDRSYVKFCAKSCRHYGKPNHTKYFTFTQTGSVRNVVMVSSSNLNKGGALKGFNDLYVLKRKGTLVRDFAKVHAEMREDTSGDGDGFLRFRRGNITASFYPKPEGGDPVMASLRRVRCQGARGRAGHGGRTAINISMFRWNSERGTTIARKLVRLDRAGCDVAIIYGAPGRKVRKVLVKSARRGGVQLWDSRVDFNLDKAVDLRVHHKYMLISGRYGRDRTAWRVHTGSQNWGKSLRAGDENTLTVLSRRAYKEYIHNWRFLSRKAARRVG